MPARQLICLEQPITNIKIMLVNIVKLGIILYTYDINTFSNILDEFNLLNYEINIIDDNLH